MIDQSGALRPRMTRRNGALQRTAGAAGWARSGWLSVAVALLVALAGCASQQIVERPAPGESSAEAVVETPPPQRIEHHTENCQPSGDSAVHIMQVCAKSAPI